MTLDEAIKHAQCVADTNCGQCAEDHRQLAEWLKELKELRKHGWHPASELPPVDRETGLSEEVIAIQDRFCDGERVIYSRIVGSGWKHPNIKFWIEQPKEG